MEARHPRGGWTRNQPAHRFANQGWSPADAVVALRGLEPFNLQFCEQPVPDWDWEGLKFVRSKVAEPVMADEAIHGPANAIAGIWREAMDSAWWAA